MDSTLSQRKRCQSEEQQPSQGRGRALRDQRLLVWMKEDFDAGFGKVVEDYWRELYSWAYKLLESSGLTYLAEDAVQEGFFSAYKDLRHHRQKLDNLNLQHWLYVIVRQKTIECLEQGRRATRLAGLLGWENDSEDMAARRVADVTYEPAYCLDRWETVREARRAVTELLTSLTDIQREVVVLRYLSQDGTEPGEITYRQLAERLIKPAGTVRSDMFAQNSPFRTEDKEGPRGIRVWCVAAVQVNVDTALVSSRSLSALSPHVFFREEYTDVFH